MAFSCYHCKEKSVRTVVFSSSRFSPLVYRTDGYCINRGTIFELVEWCTYCEKFVITPRLGSGEFYEESKKGLSINELHKLFKQQENLFPNSKASTEISKKMNESFDKSDLLPYFKTLHTPFELRFAINSSELAHEPEILYMLKLRYWQLQNTKDVRVEDIQKDIVYKDLLNYWENKTDESYLYRIEMLRNMSRFDESMELIKSPSSEYLPIMKKYKKRVRVIKTMNKLKISQAVEINI